jgi:hypothetical protein
MKIFEPRPKPYNGWLCNFFRIDSPYGFPATSVRQFRLS